MTDTELLKLGYRTVDSTWEKNLKGASALIVEGICAIVEGICAIVEGQGGPCHHTAGLIIEYRAYSY